MIRLIKIQVRTRFRFRLNPKCIFHSFPCICPQKYLEKKRLPWKSLCESYSIMVLTLIVITERNSFCGRKISASRAEGWVLELNHCKVVYEILVMSPNLSFQIWTGSEYWLCYFKMVVEEHGRSCPGHLTSVTVRVNLAVWLAGLRSLSFSERIVFPNKGGLSLQSQLFE